MGLRGNVVPAVNKITEIHLPGSPVNTLHVCVDWFKRWEPQGAFIRQSSHAEKQ